MFWNTIQDCCRTLVNSRLVVSDFYFYWCLRFKLLHFVFWMKYSIEQKTYLHVRYIWSILQTRRRWAPRKQSNHSTRRWQQLPVNANQTFVNCICLHRKWYPRFVETMDLRWLPKSRLQGELKLNIWKKYYSIQSKSNSFSKNNRIGLYFPLFVKS